MVERQGFTEAEIASFIENIGSTDDRYDAPGRHLGYGTAGFRAKATLLERACFRVGLVVAMRARSVNGRVGVMITASHNHHADNGVKIVEPDGSMLVPEWEMFSEQVVNSEDIREALVRLDDAQFPGLLPLNQ